VLKHNPAEHWAALAVATAGNTLGGMSSWLIGRLIPQKKSLKGSAAVRKYGAPVLLFSWVPVIGDPLCVAAGWLRPRSVALPLVHGARQGRALLGRGDPRRIDCLTSETGSRRRTLTTRAAACSGSIAGTPTFRRGSVADQHAAST
jgi:hypothetical protein